MMVTWKIDLFIYLNQVKIDYKIDWFETRWFIFLYIKVLLQLLEKTQQTLLRVR